MEKDAQAYRKQLRDLADEITAHDPTTCSYCAAGAYCLELHYAWLADDIVERRLNRRSVGGPS